MKRKGAEKKAEAGINTEATRPITGALKGQAPVSGANESQTALYDGMTAEQKDKAMPNQ